MKMLSVLTMSSMLGVAVVQAQTVVSLFPLGFQSLGLEGEIQGTGAAGTTYVLSGSTLGQPLTVTLVEGPSQVQEVAAFTAPGVTASVSVGCAVDTALSVAGCTVVQAVGGIVQSTTALQSFSPQAITVVTSGVAASTTTTTATTATTGTSNTATPTSTSTSTTTTSVFTPPSQTIITPTNTSASTTTTITAAPVTSSASALSLRAAGLGMGAFLTISVSILACLVGGWLIAAM